MLILLKRIIDFLSPLIPQSFKRKYALVYEVLFIPEHERLHSRAVPTPETPQPDLTPEPHPARIPNIIHFCYGMKPNETLYMFQYLSIKSAIDLNTPECVYFHYGYEPNGPWWEKIKPYLTLNPIETPTEIFGNPLYHVAHQADVVRLKMLNEIGGIYLDIDTICVKPFTDLLHHEFVMASQHIYEYGMCNAVILAAPQSEFGRQWRQTYESFRSKGRDEYWDEHSVRIPWQLAKQMPDHITVLPKDAFFKFDWNDVREYLFDAPPDMERSILNDSYCFHLWETNHWDFYKALDEAFIANHKSSYTRLARRHLSRETFSIVFLTYNRKSTTMQCMESFMHILDRDDVLELLIFDNSSTDGVREYALALAERHPKIRVILSDTNVGVCPGRIRLFEEARGDIIVSLDSDAVLVNEFFLDKCRFILSHEDIGMCGTAGAVMTSWDFGSHQDLEDDAEGYVDLLAGCCQVFKRSLFEQGVTLDPAFAPFWVEDSDFSLQILNLDKKLVKISASEVLKHTWGGSGTAQWPELFEKHWKDFAEKWRGKGLTSFEKSQPHDLYIGQANNRPADTVANEIAIPAQSFTHVPLLPAKHLDHCRLVTDRYALLDKMPVGGVVAEIGVLAGDFSESILDKARPQSLYLLDSFTAKDWAHSNRFDEKSHYAYVQRRFSRLTREETVVLQQGDSLDLLAGFPDHFFDWVYLDTTHDYEYTRAELLTLQSKVKENGYIIVSDYTYYDHVLHVPYGVVHATNEFCLDHNWELIYLAFDRSMFCDVALRKIQ